MPLLGGIIGGVLTPDVHTLPWYLVAALLTALLAVFYALLRGKLLSNRVAEMLRESAETRARIAEEAASANTETVQSLTESVEKLVAYAENADKVLRALSERAGRGNTHVRGGPS